MLSAAAIMKPQWTEHFAISYEHASLGRATCLSVRNSNKTKYFILAMLRNRCRAAGADNSTFRKSWRQNREGTSAKATPRRHRKREVQSPRFRCAVSALRLCLRELGVMISESWRRLCGFVALRLCFRSSALIASASLIHASDENNAENDNVPAHGTNLANFMIFYSSRKVNATCSMCQYGLEQVRSRRRKAAAPIRIREADVVTAKP